MKAKGLLPKEVSHQDPYATKIAADTVDAVKWQDQKNEELKSLKMQDVSNEKPWLDELIEDFIAFDLSPNNTSEEASKILKELDKELTAIEDSGYGPEARDYIFKLKRELELMIDQL